jgi:hypothetical protein
MPKWVIAVIVAVLVLCCCVSAVAIVASGIGLAAFQSISSHTISTPVVEIPTYPPDDTPESSFSDIPSGNSTVEPIPTATAGQSDGGAELTLQQLESIVVPEADPIELTERLQGKKGISETVDSPKPTGIGEERSFWVSNVDTNENFQVKATLRYVGDHTYFWIQNGLDYTPKALEKLGNAFDQKMYETDREFFGSEWNPGIDNDPKLYILYASGLGENIAAYFSSADEIPPDAHKYSNAHEMFIVNYDTTRIEDDYVYGTLAHEFQHMIHWYRDRNEEGWLNEGFSELASFLNGYDPGGFDYLFTSDPDLQLNTWPNDPSNPNATPPHYGAGFLFTTYFLDRFGEDLTKALIAEKENGFDSIDKVFTTQNVTDPETGKPITADDVFADWVVANYLNQENVADGRYFYHNYTGLMSPSPTETISNCPTGTLDRDVSQYGTDYIEITCEGKLNLTFQGTSEVSLVPENAKSGDYAIWSNEGDTSDMKLSQDFDFTKVSGPIEMSYSTWFDIEKDYDYLYLEASTDGQTWSLLKTPSGTDTDPTGANYGWGYTGTTNGWVKETVDLSSFAGKKVTLRFEYVTDAAVNGEGLLLDDVSIPAIQYSTDFETDEGGWTADGFVRMENRLPQTYRVSLIQYGNETKVTPVEIDANGRAEVSLDLGGDVDSAVLVVSGTTRFTRQKADYQVSVNR